MHPVELAESALDLTILRGCLINGGKERMKSGTMKGEDDVKSSCYLSQSAVWGYKEPCGSAWPVCRERLFKKYPILFEMNSLLYIN